jgi:transcriptional regulator with XRE-family HTH domain
MNSLGERILSLRKQKGMSQSDLAKLIGVSYAQVGRYETKGAQPPAEVLKKIADALNTTTDFLMYGSKDDKAKASLDDEELLLQFKEVNKMNDEDKSVIKKVLQAFITQSKLQKLMI